MLSTRTIALTKRNGRLPCHWLAADPISFSIARCIQISLIAADQPCLKCVLAALTLAALASPANESHFSIATL